MYINLNTYLWHTSEIDVLLTGLSKLICKARTQAKSFQAEIICHKSSVRHLNKTNSLYKKLCIKNLWHFEVMDHITQKITLWTDLYSYSSHVELASDLKFCRLLWQWHQLQTWNSNLRIAVLLNVRLVHFSHVGCSLTFFPELQVNCNSNCDPSSLVQDGKGSCNPPAAEVASRSRGNCHSFFSACHEKDNCFLNTLLSLQDKRRVLCCYIKDSKQYFWY